MAIKTTLFFPFNDYSFSLIDYVKKINGDFVVASCKGTGLIGRDVAYSVNMPDLGVNVLDIADVSWNQITDFVILNPGDNLALYKQIKKVYILAKENKITIHDLTGYFDTKIKQKKDNESFSPRPISPIEKPIIYISGIFDSIHNSLISLNLKFYLKEAGYNSKIMTYNKNLKYSNDIIFDSSFLEKPEKLYFTQYKLYEQIKRLDDDMNVDLIIVQVPGGFSQLNNYVFNDFGIYFSFLNNLIRPDYLIVSLPYDFIDRDMVKEIEDVSESKYNKKIDAFVVNNGYWRFGEGTTLSSQPKDTYLPFSLLDSIKENDMYTINYSELVDSIINILGEYDDR